MQNIYRLLYPRQVALISTRSKAGKSNLMTLVWITPVSAEPPLVGIAIAPAHYTHKLIEETGEFVIGMAGEGMEDAVLKAGSGSGRDREKFKESGLTEMKASKVSAPLIKECPINLECKLAQKHKIGDHTFFVGEVLAAHVFNEKAKMLQNAYDKEGKRVFFPVERIKN